MKMVSIIIPVYNHAFALLKSIQSVFLQTHRPLEIIVVDDGSEDKITNVLTLLQAESFKKEIPIKIIRQKNMGAPAARNRGFASSKGEYVIFWDADTIARPEMISEMLAVLENNPSISYAYCMFKFGWKKMRSHVFDADFLKIQNYIDTTSLIRRDAFCGFDESLRRFQDWDLWLTLLEKSETGFFIPKVLFAKQTTGRKGISRWLPAFTYKLPWKNKAVRDYEAARTAVLRKHGLLPQP